MVLPVRERGELKVSNDSSPSEEVAVSVYPFDVLPSKSWPYDGVVARPVPPLPMPSVPVRRLVPIEVVAIS